MWCGAQTKAQHVVKVGRGVFDLTPSDKQMLVKSVSPTQKRMKMSSFRSHFNRREFIAISSLSTAAVLLPSSLHAAQSIESDSVTLYVTGDATLGFGVT